MEAFDTMKSIHVERQKLLDELLEAIPQTSTAMRMIEQEYERLKTKNTCDILGSISGNTVHRLSPYERRLLVEVEVAFRDLAKLHELHNRFVRLLALGE